MLSQHLCEQQNRGQAILESDIIGVHTFFCVPSFELANPEPRTIRRYGGSTSTENPWPEDEFADKGSLEAR